VNGRHDEYVALLAEAWRAFRAPRAGDSPTVVSTFAGAGGSSMGYGMAGFRELLAVEYDDHAVRCLRQNFPGLDVYHGDIAGLSVAECLRRTGLSPGELDVFDGSPPCQGFSMAGSRVMDDKRNQLFREFVRLLRGLEPRAFVMENVAGMVKGDMKLLFAEAIRELKASGYAVRCALLNAQWYGVPQHRTRLIFVGVREDLDIEPSHPAPWCEPFTVSDAIGVSGFGLFSSGWNSDKRVNFKRPAPCIQKHGIDRSSNLQFMVHAGGRSEVSGYLPAPLLTGEGLRVAREMRPGQNGSDIREDDSWYGAIRLHPGQPSPTVTKSSGLWNRYPNWVHPAETRGLSIGEVMRLQSFPDGYQFPCDGMTPREAWVEAWARIGNSVPPLMMRSIAIHVLRLIRS